MMKFYSNSLPSTTFNIGLIVTDFLQLTKFRLAISVVFSSLAGYDIRESINLWKRMAEKNKGKEPPVFLSTHPSSKKRIENLNNWINEVIIKYPPISA